MINKIYNQDCLITMSNMPDNYIDLTVTSPPYDNLREYRGYSFDFESIAKELFRVTKDGGVVVWVVGDATINGSETLTSFKQALYFKEIGFNVHDTMIYQKNNFSNPSSNRYHQIFEYMFIFSKGKPKTFNPIIDRKNIYGGKIGSWGKNTVRQKDGTTTERPRKIVNEYGKRYNIWKYKTSKNGQEDKIAYQHPAIFPSQLANDHILTWTNPDDIIYDCFGGSGTTGIMANINNRNFILSEVSSEYCELMQNRFKQRFNLDIEIIK